MEPIYIVFNISLLVSKIIQDLTKWHPSYYCSFFYHPVLLSVRQALRMGVIRDFLSPSALGLLLADRCCPWCVFLCLWTSLSSALCICLSTGAALY